LTFLGLKSERRSIVDVLAGMFAEERAVFHVTAMLPPSSSRQSLERCLRGWAARVDRFYLGRNWSRHHERRMKGVVFFESHPYVHAHMVVVPPVGANPRHFNSNAGYWFERHPDRGVRALYPRPVADRGRMLIQRIKPSVDDLDRVLFYASKEMEFRPSANEDWKFLADLSGS
jgi:hypothetical protein